MVLERVVESDPFLNPKYNGLFGKGCFFFRKNYFVMGKL